ncbi:MAG: hypothetical protein K2K92_05705 [Duncaniella sp.]|nr:hypothetical protein [Duncaniella sp.]
MKLCNYLYSFALAAATMTVVSCSPDPDPEIGPFDELPSSKMYILNQGLWNQNNATVSLYSPADVNEPVVSEFFKRQNGREVGELAQDLIRHGDLMYMAVTGSNYVACLNSECVNLRTVSFAGESSLQGGVRCLAAYGNDLFATCYGGYLVKIDASYMTLNNIHSVGHNLEGIAAYDGKLYIADAYEIRPNDKGGNDYVYLDDLYVVDANTLQNIDVIKVAVNPNRVISTEEGKIFVISWGNYADKGYQCQMIDAAHGNKVTDIAVASDMCVGNGKLYLLYSTTDWATNVTTNNWMSYDIASGTLSETSFLKDAPAALANSHIYMMTVEPVSGDIYIGTTDYTTEGDIYRFDKNGNLIKKFACGGLNPWRAVFF